ncbi:hypothetical protein NLX83_03500 [Allokutzneria sp. A3M-2-11 16]|uniref:hypothetical protein n=1 Tax=Allokutzneria sp. A3M-2-11 16 TaxID=2962043 RepID=UPI0020B7E63C|nr:hypothetical protein [Allokutzneria sp. A3M-2-11 16]MCP3798316.1 hypothetical protein [Allokutzneria sp. A3M-2-11 16]
MTAVAVILAAGYARRWISDDGLIYVRAVEQILAGNGPVFNAGERAESSTGTLWQWLLTVVGFVLPDSLPELAVYLGLALTGAAVAFGVTGSQRLHGGAPLPAGVVILLALSPMWDFATSGLETGLAFAWIAGAWWLLVNSRDSSKESHLGLAFVFGLGPLVRPDLALVSIVFLMALWLLHRPAHRTTVRLLAVAGALPVAYQVFRMGYYGVLVPLPAISKEASDSHWLRGLAYFFDLFLVYGLLIPVGIVLWVGLRRRLTRSDRILVLAPVIAGALSVLYVVKVGGDFMHGRMLLPGLLLVLLPFFCLPRASSRTVRKWAGTGLAAWAVLAALVLRTPYTPALSPTGIADERYFYRGLTGVDNPVSKEDFVNAEWVKQGWVESAQRELVFATNKPAMNVPRMEPLGPNRPHRVGMVWQMLGSAGAVTPLDQLAIDPIGLSYPLAAHLELTDRNGRVGHEKMLPRVWISADYGMPTKENEAARRALSCGDLAELQESVRAPMTWERFVANFFGSFSRTTLRVPVDPVAAERLFCG